MTTKTTSGRWILTEAERQALENATAIEKARRERAEARVVFVEQENKELWELTRFVFRLMKSAQGNVNKVCEQVQLYFQAKENSKVQNK